ncbi:hypothetical protein [Solirubrobacter soli]|uniref:hypothetical protein n=1 Tax=Solirubrobacter soli TaxID=363832 RepID=UPI00041263B2|nr:hypothetical protein [Solirubrobacter soli]
MSLGDTVVWLPEPFVHGTGTVTDFNEIGWIEVVWQSGELGLYCPSALEQADLWEQAQVEAALRRFI